ncbi:aminoglycoside 6'-N-acetyltransferase [Bosea sp. LC85]|uniref:aminoglycoside 6'-N-acetyltransferase n=1 Tax=Bosea sp. LC85 TaxID=1502851 RepID=UPI0006983C27|nr:aminoglycoside 6'-N-acetyltransferase [Bosea sp. LC85]
MLIETCTDGMLEDWVRLRLALWPDSTAQEHRDEAVGILESPSDTAFIARNDAGAAIGLAEAALRHDYVNGCETSPVGFLEGIHVEPGWRRHGVARALCAAVETWAKRHGCVELASDTDLSNAVSQQTHDALGFEETERVVFYRKLLQSR